MNESKELRYFLGVFNKVVKDGSKFNKNYSSMGGIWAVDTWRLENVYVSSMDDGYTKRIYVPGRLEVIENYRGNLTFNIGNVNTLKVLYESVSDYNNGDHHINEEGVLLLSSSEEQNVKYECDSHGNIIKVFNVEVSKLELLVSEDKRVRLLSKLVNNGWKNTGIIKKNIGNDVKPVYKSVVSVCKETITELKELPYVKISF